MQGRKSVNLTLYKARATKTPFLYLGMATCPIRKARVEWSHLAYGSFRDPSLNLSKKEPTNLDSKQEPSGTRPASKGSASGQCNRAWFGILESNQIVHRRYLPFLVE
ncbi:cysteine/Histidine-rich C1 domain family protein, partial [Striga asiatica]